MVSDIFSISLRKMSNLVYETETNVSVIHAAKVAKERN